MQTQINLKRLRNKQKEVLQLLLKNYFIVKVEDLNTVQIYVKDHEGNIEAELSDRFLDRLISRNLLCSEKAPGSVDIEVTHYFIEMLYCNEIWAAL